MGKVYVLFELELKPGVNEQEFETFALNEFTPIYQRVPGQKAYLVKGDRGERAGKYAIVIEVESRQARDQIYPLEGQMSKEFEQATADAGPIWHKLVGFVADFPGPHFTDYVTVTG
jgi:hypothetical protein